MWPKEHGAYGQLAFPLITAFAVAGVHAASALLAMAVVAAFLLHEPLLLLLGRRGARIRQLGRRRAIAWLLGATAVAVTTGAAALWLTSPGARWTFGIPLSAAVVYGVLLAMREEKSTAGELAAACAFSLVAVPVCVIAGTSLGAAWLVALTFAALSSASTLGVRVVILRVRGGGDPAAVKTTRILFAAVILCAALAFTALQTEVALSWAASAAALPGLVVSSLLAFRPPSPAKLRTVGWTLVTASATATVLLVLGL
jgi:hypothetical protein